MMGKMPVRLLVVPFLLALELFGQNPSDMMEPFPPHHVIDNIYYVGSRGLASYLVTTPQGHILINSSFEASAPLIRASIEKLGFHFHDVKILLISHAHADHCAGSALVKAASAAGNIPMPRLRPVAPAPVPQVQP